MTTANNATQTDALEQHDEETTSTETTENQVANPRMSAMEAIAEQRRASLAADGVDTSTMEPIAGAVVTDDTTTDDQIAAQIAQDDRPSLAGDTMRVKVKVDGEELDLPLSEVVKSYQKDAAASKRLQEATRIHTEATRLLEIASQKASTVAQNVDQENNSVDVVDSGKAKEAMVGKIKGAASKLYEGDEEGFATDIAALIENAGATKAVATPQPIDTAAIAAQVTQQLEVNSAYGQVKSDYPAIFASDERGVVLGKACFERMSAKETAGTPRAQAMREATEEVAKLFNIEKAGRQTQDPTRTARDEKLARKADLDSLESANVVATSASAPVEAPNVSAVIAEMAARRLGQSLPKR